MAQLQFWETHMMIESPGWTGNMFCVPWGNISHQDTYLGRPEAQSVEIPTCSTVGVPAPSSPTQKEAFELELVHVTVGTLNLAATLRNFTPRWARSMYPVQLLPPWSANGAKVGAVPERVLAAAE